MGASQRTGSWSLGSEIIRSNWRSLPVALMILLLALRLVLLLLLGTMESSLDALVARRAAKLGWLTLCFFFGMLSLNCFTATAGFVVELVFRIFDAVRTMIDFGHSFFLISLLIMSEQFKFILIIKCHKYLSAVFLHRCDSVVCWSDANRPELLRLVLSIASVTNLAKSLLSLPVHWYLNSVFDLFIDSQFIILNGHVLIPNNTIHIFIDIDRVISLMLSNHWLPTRKYASISIGWRRGLKVWGLLKKLLDPVVAAIRWRGRRRWLLQTCKVHLWLLSLLILWRVRRRHSNSVLLLWLASFLSLASLSTS